MKKFVDFVKRNLNAVVWILIYILLTVYIWIFGDGLAFKICYSFVGLILIAINISGVVELEKQLKSKNSKTTKGEDNV